MNKTTEFSGELKFTEVLTALQLEKLKDFLGSYRGYDWIKSEGVEYVSLKLLKDYSGLEWNYVRSNTEMVKTVNMVVVNMQKQWPTFGLKGVLLAQTENVGEHWSLVINNGLASKRPGIIAGSRIKCPKCGGSFLY